VKSKLLHESEGQRTFAVVLAPGDEVTDRLLSFARENRVGAAAVSAIGALRRATVAFYNPEAGDYEPIQIDEQVEVLSLAGDIALGDDDEPRLHLHAALSKRDGSAWGGHLLEAEVRPTLEAIVTESPPPLRRRVDPGSGLALLDLQPEDSG
jgi:predicted DNA-binding protein with PD1-like motif